MLYLLLWGLSMNHVDTSKIELGSSYKNIKIFNSIGGIKIEYISSAEFSSPLLTIKKGARGERKEFERWIKKVKIITKEENNFYEIKVNFPNRFDGLDNQKVDLILTLPYTLDYIQANVLNGYIWIDNFISKKYKINVSNGVINVEEIKGEGEIEVDNGEINFKISHNEILNVKLKVSHGNILILCPDFTQIFPRVTNGEIKGDLFFEKSNVSQRIECEICNGTLRIKRE